MNKIFGFMAILLLLVSCGKDKTDQAKNSSIIGSWGYESIIEDGQAFTITADLCSADDRITFYADGTVVMDPGQDLCDPTEDQIERGTYRTEGTNIFFTDSDNPGEQETLPYILNGDQLIFEAINADDIEIRFARK